MVKPIVYQNQNQELVGMLELPKNVDQPVPAVIMCHGFRGSKIGPHRMFVKLARRLATKNIASFRFDYRGSGDSEGESKRKTVSGEIFDTLKTIEDIKKRPEIDGTKLFLLGFSLGGAVAAATAARNGEINNLILWSAIADLDKFFFANILKDMDQNLFKRKGFANFSGYQIGSEFLDELKMIKPLDEIKAYQGATLLIHSQDDQVVPVSHVFSYYQNFINEDKELLILEDSDHHYLDFEKEQKVITETTDWINSRVDS